nr:uncharacterized protein LOC118877339 [Drosophila suzukii]
MQQQQQKQKPQRRQSRQRLLSLELGFAFSPTLGKIIKNNSSRLFKENINPKISEEYKERGRGWEYRAVLGQGKNNLKIRVGKSCWLLPAVVAGCTNADATTLFLPLGRWEPLRHPIHHPPSTIHHATSTASKAMTWFASLSLMLYLRFHV